MQISRTLFTTVVAALLAVPAFCLAQDTDAQAKAREALRRKLAELDGKPAPETAAAATAVTTPETTEKLREAMRKKIQELNDSEPLPAAPAPAPTKVAKEKPAPAPKPAAPPKAEKPAKPAPAPKAAKTTKPAPAAPTAGTSQLTPDQVEQVRESVRKQISDLNTTDKPAPAPKVEKPVPAPKPEKPAPAPKPEKPKKPEAAPATPKGFAPIPAPPTHLPATKEARLAELLRQYKADQITPEQYHKERAKILAEP